jgi:hypothetical protein
LGRLIASALPRPPARWSSTSVAMASPIMVLWGLFCAGMLIRGGNDLAEPEPTAEAAIFRSFSFIMLVAAALLIVTGRSEGRVRPAYLWSGMAIAGAYTLIWMFNGKRSHSLMGVLTAACAFYISKGKRPSWPVLITTGLLGATSVAVAIGWRNDRLHERSFSGFASYLADFQPESILKNFNVEDGQSEDGAYASHETKEYGGFLLMMDTVPERAEYDYGASYLRTFSTFIPRMVWQDKPLYGREAWVNAWIAGSELKRDTSFTGPAIGILGATQLNGGAIGTVIVLACVALLIRTAYDYFRLHADAPLVQAFWSVTYFNAWFMVVGDDPMNWFYYNWGFTTMPVLVFFFFLNKFGQSTPAVVPAATVA